jgi:hypothetical protein
MLVGSNVSKRENCVSKNSLEVVVVGAEGADVVVIVVVGAAGVDVIVDVGLADVLPPTPVDI